MKRYTVCLIALVYISVVFATICKAGNTTGSLVSTMWLGENMFNHGVTIVDIRKVEEYKEGHIPGSISLTFTAWRTAEKNLDCQLPAWDDLEDTVCSLGLHEDSHIVIVGKTTFDQDLVNTTRVAWTLKYAGVKSLSILDGGYTKWISENRPVSITTTRPAKGSFRRNFNSRILATKKDVSLSCDRKAAIVDTRPSTQYTGETVCATVRKKGHIPGAMNLPYSLVFTKEGGFEAKDRLQAITSRFIGDDRNREIIILCTNGQYASSWWFALSEILDYKDVRIYDGSMEEWCCDETSPLATEPVKPR
jgi:thiosulfate/3-mercaptopyruvate sulfurtransferase